MLVALCCALGAFGLFRAISPPAKVTVLRPAQGAPDLPAQEFARRFVAVYLSYDASRPDRRQRALAQFIGDEASADADFGYTPPRAGRRRVLETTVVQVYPKGHGTAEYVVAARTAADTTLHLATVVARDEHGSLGVVGYPALVGGPSTTGAIERSVPLKAVKDEGMREVAERALRNWLAHSRNDLAADLTPSADVSLPDQRLQLDSVDELMLQDDSSLLATVVAIERQRGEQFTLTYELNIERHGGRWAVSAIHVLPTWH